MKKYYFYVLVGFFSVLSAHAAEEQYDMEGVVGEVVMDSKLLANVVTIDDKQYIMDITTSVQGDSEGYIPGELGPIFAEGERVAFNLDTKYSKIPRVSAVLVNPPISASGLNRIVRENKQ